MTGQEFNQKLAKACQQCQAACCKKGRLFLPRKEYEAIRAHLGKSNPAALQEFQDRTADHETFLLYDQKNCCQFLDEANLCRLHSLGLKPSECFWWPYHVYADSAGQLEVRLSTACCDAYKSHGPHSPYPRLIGQRVAEIGPEVVRAFRRIFRGNGKSLPVGPLAEPVPIAETDRSAESSLPS
jgi:hypothetical protein